ncbi:hypothetical protein I79_014556 [Cricetulus griseus]|uniref:Uncharacterized protein n=1 Tax=Cricetulus griseus TaxID=10029 RepID=G3HUE7_CRIGR|nr:hypothetical protein I79_014556 [Cricetulus griseus]
MIKFNVSQSKLMSMDNWRNDLKKWIPGRRSVTRLMQGVCRVPSSTMNKVNSSEASSWAPAHFFMCHDSLGSSSDSHICQPSLYS